MSYWNKYLLLAGLLISINAFSQKGNVTATGRNSIAARGNVEYTVNNNYPASEDFTVVLAGYRLAWFCRDSVDDNKVRQLADSLFSLCQSSLYDEESFKINRSKISNLILHIGKSSLRLKYYSEYNDTDVRNNSNSVFTRLLKKYLDDGFNSVQEDSISVLIANGANPLIRGEQGSTTLMFAAVANNFKLAQYLIKAGVDLEAKTRDVKWTALLLASRSGAYETFKILLDSGANLFYISNQINRDAFYLAVEYNHQEIVKLALEKGYNVNRIIDNSNALLNVLSPFGRPCAALETEKMLIENGIDIERVDYDDATAFMRAVDEGCVELVKILFTRTRNTQGRYKKTGFTPLMTAVKNNNIEMVNTILINENNLSYEYLNAISPHGYTALDFAKHIHNETIIRQLKKVHCHRSTNRKHGLIGDEIDR